MSQDNSNTIFIRANANIIYQAFANPQALETWMAPGDMSGKLHHFDWREGGSYEMSLFYPDHEKYSHGKTADKEDRYSAKLLILKPAQQIVLSVIFNSPDPQLAGEMIMEIQFHPQPGGTDIRFIFKNMPPGINPDDNEKGTQLTLQKLKHYVEEGHTGIHSLPEIDEQDSDGSANAFEDK